jgi:hypothetical protein
MSFIKSAIRSVLPNSVLDWRRALQKKRAEEKRAQYHRDRYKRINKVAGLGSTKNLVKADDYESIVQFLIDRGIAEHHIREGSIPLSSLRFIQETVFSKLDRGSPSYLLHLGNFVGVSLAYMTQALTKVNSESLVFAIDPNVPHRDVENPQAHVMALLNACDLQRNVVPIVGYSLKKNVSNDGAIFDTYDPVTRYDEEMSCENILANLQPVMKASFDVVCFDGNHDGQYLRSELENIIPLLKMGAWIVLDDANAAWAEIHEVFKDIPHFGFETVATDGRVGIAKSTSSTPPRVAAKLSTS